MKDRLLAFLERMSPVTAMLWRKCSEVRQLHKQIDALKADLAVSQCREKRWKRHAEFASEGNPEAEWCVAQQSWSDEMADLDEIEDHQRNWFPSPPRSLP